MFELRMEGPGKNCLGTEMMDFILERLREAGGRPLLLTGVGDAFSAGLNLKEVARLDVPGMEVFLQKLEAVVSALYTYPGPTVALVNGHAIAGGCILALSCDYRVAKADPALRIGLNEVALGVRFPPGILRMVRQQLPPQHFSEIVLGASLHSPQESLRLGLIDAVEEDADSAARRKLLALAAHSADVYAATKADLRGQTLLRPGDADLLRGLLATWTSQEVKQRVRAVLERSAR